MRQFKIKDSAMERLWNCGQRLLPAAEEGKAENPNMQIHDVEELIHCHVY